MTVSVAAVLPVRDLAGLAAGCLDGLLKQTAPLDEIIVVDDGPTPTIKAVPGVTVVPSYGRGPYAARNVGWRHSSADVILFLDARCRPKPEWSATMARRFEEPTTALVGSDVKVQDGPSLSAHASHLQQFFLTRNTAADPYFLPYLPTCNLGARRTDLEKVGGFLEVRSGGDADLCWRILGLEGRQLRTIERPLMEWIPRDRLRDYLEQNYRYGRSHVELCRRWAAAGAEMRPPTPLGRLLARGAANAARLARARDRTERARHLVAIGSVAVGLGHRRELRNGAPTRDPGHPST